MRKVTYFNDRISFTCHIFNTKGLSIELSDKLKEKFNNYFHMINSIVEKDNKDDINLVDINKLIQDYKAIQELAVDEIRQSGNKKSIYTDELLELLYWKLCKILWRV